MGANLASTFADFFGTGEMTESEAASAIAALQADLKRVDELTACLGNKITDCAEWSELWRLGYAQRVDGPREGSYRWELKGKLLADDRASAALTPAEYAKRHNARADD